MTNGLGATLVRGAVAGLMLGCWLLAGHSTAAAVSGTLIVLNKAEATASLIDLESGQARTKLETGQGPHEAAVSSDGRWAVVANYGVGGAPGNSLTVLDLSKGAVRSVIDLGDYHRPHGILYLPDSGRVLVTAEQEQKLLVVDVEKGSVETAIDTDASVSHMVAVTPDGKRAFVANIGSGSMTAIDLENGKLLQEIETGEGAEGIDVTPDGKEVWVTNRGADTVSIIDTQSLEVLAKLESASFPIRLKFTVDGKRALVSNARSGDVAVFDVATRKEIARVPMMSEKVAKTDQRLFGDNFGDSPVPVGILMHPSGKFAYVANTNADVITVLDLEKLEAVDRLVAGEEPDGMAYSSLTVEM